METRPDLFTKPLLLFGKVTNVLVLPPADPFESIHKYLAHAVAEVEVGVGPRYRLQLRDRARARSQVDSARHNDV